MEPLLRREIPETLLELFLVSNMCLINAGPLLVHTTKRKLLAYHVFFYPQQQGSSHRRSSSMHTSVVTNATTHLKLVSVQTASKKKEQQ